MIARCDDRCLSYLYYIRLVITLDHRAGGCLDRLEDVEAFGGANQDRGSATFQAELVALKRTVATLSELQFPGTGILSGYRAQELLDVIEPPKLKDEDNAMTTVDVYLAALQRIGSIKAGI